MAQKLSRSKVDLFMRCPRCFYLDVVMGIGRPKMPSFTLNNAVDALMKKEFDIHRVAKTKHPLFEKYGIDAIPFSHAKLEDWRTNFTGIRFVHKATDLLLTGAVDDIWVSPNGELFVVDYKATAKDKTVDKLDDTEWHDQYRRQMEFYQWLLRQSGFKVSDIGYFVYVNGQKDKKAFDAKLEFDVHVISYKGNDEWIEPILLKIRECLDSPVPPKAAGECEYCDYRTRAGKALQALIVTPKKATKEKSTTKKEKKAATKEQIGHAAPTLF